MALFGFGKPKPSPVELYGKLPIAKDYLRVGGGAGGGLALRSWMDATYSTGNVDRSADRFPWPMRFVLGAERDGDPVLGSLWNSTDAGGERAFPFAIFAECSAKQVRQSIGEGLERLIDIWQDCESLYYLHEDSGDGESFLARARGRTTMPDEDPAAQTPFPLAIWAASLWPADGLGGLENVFREIQGLARQDYDGGVRVPLIVDISMPAQVAAWLVVLERAGLLEERRPPTVFFPQGVPPAGEPAFLTVFRRPLTTADRIWLASAKDPQSGMRADLCGSAPRHQSELRSEDQGDVPLVQAVARAIGAWGS